MIYLTILTRPTTIYGPRRSASSCCTASLAGPEKHTGESLRFGVVWRTVWASIVTRNGTDLSSIPP